jgi:UTP--glucose-1-phosphate uridylyltransferase
MSSAPVTKAVIPAAGLGTRLLPCTKSQPKEMLPVGRLPAIQHVVEELFAAGAQHICMVTGWQKRAIEDHFDVSHGGAKLLGGDDAVGVLADGGLNHRLFYIRQAEQRGLGDAVQHAAPFIGSEDFLVALGDSILYSPAEPILLTRLLAAHQAADDVFATIAVENVPRQHVVRYGIVDPAGPLAAEGPTLIRDIVEKPTVADAPSTFAVAARYVFSPIIFEALGRTAPGRGGEIQLTDAVRMLIREGHRCQVVPLAAGERRFDIGNYQSYYRAFLDMALADPQEGEGLRQYLRGRLAES